MAIDTPATLGIIGAGPAGLEASLYARFLGYEVHLFESAEVAGRLKSDVPLGRFGDNSSSLGRAAIAAQYPDQPLPLLTASLTESLWRERYLLPLSECDLVVDCLRKNATVTRVSKEHLQGDEVTGFDRGGYDFVVEFTGADNCNESITVDAVIDATGCEARQGKLYADFRIFESLDLRLDPQSGFPMICTDYGDELPDGTKLTEEAKKLLLHEPNYYVIGSKSTPGGNLPYSALLSQIRAIFTILGDRTSLDLYATAVTLPQ